MLKYMYVIIWGSLRSPIEYSQVHAIYRIPIKHHINTSNIININMYIEYIQVHPILSRNYIQNFPIAIARIFYIDGLGG